MITADTALRKDYAELAAKQHSHTTTCAVFLMCSQLVSIEMGRWCIG